MRRRGHLCTVTVATLLTAGLASWPMAAAAAAGQSSPDTEKGNRSERAAALQMEKTETKFSPIALRLYGGYSRAELGDINKGLDGYYEIFETYKAMVGGTSTGGYNPLHEGYNFGADLVFQFSPKFGVGIGAGYMRFSKSSAMTYSIDSDHFEVSGTPTLSAVPIRLGLFLTLPLGKGLNLTINGGADAYAALKLDSTQRMVMNDSQGEVSLSASGGTPFENIGFHGSLGFELMVLPNTGFFVEVEGRYARLKNFEKAKSTSGGGDTEEGQLYIWTQFSEYGNPSMFVVREFPPERQPDYSEPKIDVSGFSLQAGLRIRL